MRKAEVYIHDQYAGTLEELDQGRYQFTYRPDYQGPAVSLTMPVSQRAYHYDRFPPFFEGLLPEGFQLDSLVRREKLDQSDYFGQLLVVGNDLIGAVTVRKSK